MIDGRIVERRVDEPTLVGLDYRHVPSYGEGAAGFSAERAPADEPASAGSIRITFAPCDDGDECEDRLSLYFWDEEDVDVLIDYLERCKELFSA